MLDAGAAPLLHVEYGEAQEMDPPPPPQNLRVD